MQQRVDRVREASRYLRENDALRQAVGAAPYAVLSPHYLGVGEHNLNFRFTEPASGRAFVLRVNVATQPFHENQVAYEFAALQALEPSGCTPRPVYLDDSPNAPGKGAIVETFCEGRELDFDHLQAGDLECAVRLMAEVHAVPVRADCPLYRPADPARELFEECLERFRVYRGSAFEEARLTKWVERFIAQTEALLSNAECRADDCHHIINTEPLPSHFLVPASSADSEGEGAEGAPNRANEPLQSCFAPAYDADSEGEGVGGEQNRVLESPSHFLVPTSSADSEGEGAEGASNHAYEPLQEIVGKGEAALPIGDAALTACSPSGEAPAARFAGAFIDWERPIIGEVAQDVVYFVAPTTTFWDSDWWCPADTAAELVEAYWRAVDGRFSRGTFDKRFPLYRALTALRSTTWCCRALVQYSQAGAHKTQKAVEKIPSYLSDDFLAQLANECFE